MAKRLPEGISLRHARSCPRQSGGRCRCAPTYQAQAWSPGDRKRLTRTFPTLAAARGWRYDALVGLRSGTLRAAGGVTLRAAADEWLAAAEAGIVRNRSGDVYKPSALRGYEQSLRARLLPGLGGAKLADIRRSDVQRLVHRRCRRQHRSQLPAAAARDLPPSPRARRGGGQPDDRRPAPRPAR